MTTSFLESYNSNTPKKMRSTQFIAGFAAIASASPLVPRASCDTANDFSASGCADVAMIFARGTFDSG